MLQFLNASNQSYVLYCAEQMSQNHLFNNRMVHIVDSRIKPVEDNNDENCCLCDIPPYICKGLSTVKMLRAQFQLNNLIIHMQICKWETKTKNQRKTKLRFWRSVHQTLPRMLFALRSLLPYTLRSVCVAPVDATTERNVMRAIQCASNNKREREEKDLQSQLYLWVCCLYGCQILSVVRIFLNKSGIFVPSLVMNVVSN